MELNQTLPLAIVLWLLSIFIAFVYSCIMGSIQKKTLESSLLQMLNNGLLTFISFRSAKNNRKWISYKDSLQVLESLIEKLGKSHLDEEVSTKIKTVENLIEEVEKYSSLVKLPDSIQPKIQQLRHLCPNADVEISALVNVLDNELSQMKQKVKLAKRAGVLSISFTILCTIIGALLSLPRISAIIENFLFGS